MKFRVSYRVYEQFVGRGSWLFTVIGLGVRARLRGWELGSGSGLLLALRVRVRVRVAVRIRVVSDSICMHALFESSSAFLKDPTPKPKPKPKPKSKPKPKPKPKPKSKRKPNQNPTNLFNVSPDAPWWSFSREGRRQTKNRITGVEKNVSIKDSRFDNKKAKSSGLRTGC
jgi:hypothetical protein